MGPQGALAQRRRSQVKAPVRSGQVRYSLDGKTLGEAVHSYNSHGAGEQQRVNAMFFSLRPNALESHGGSALLGSDQGSADRRMLLHMARQTSAPTFVVRPVPPPHSLTRS